MEMERYYRVRDREREKKNHKNKLTPEENVVCLSDCCLFTLALAQDLAMAMALPYKLAR